MADLSPREIIKYEWRKNLLVDKIWQDKCQLKLTDGSYINVDRLNVNDTEYLVSNTEDAKSLKTYLSTFNSKTEFPLKILLHGNIHTENQVKETWISSSKLEKTKEFGGIPSSVLYSAENTQLQKLQILVQTAVNNSGGPIDLLFLGKTYKNIIEVRKCKSAASKGDFEFVDIVDSSFSPQIWLSHKSGNNPRDMRQWSGISKFNSPQIDSFVNAIEDSLYQMGVNSFPTLVTAGAAFTLARKVINTPDRLAEKSVFGLEFASGQHSEENVNAVCQGNFHLYNKRDFWELACDKIWKNGVLPTGEYEPTLFAYGSNGRNDSGIKNCRIVIMPFGARKIFQMI